MLVRDLAARGIGHWREHVPKHRVDPRDDRRLRAEVAGKIETLDGNACNARLRLRVKEDADLGLAKPVDRLHRIADGEERAAVARLPAGGELRDQFAVRPRRVLELVDEQMGQPVIDGEQQLAGIVGIAECGQCPQRGLAEIGCAFLCEDGEQVTCDLRQESKRGLDEVPCGVAVNGRRQRSRGMQRIRQPGNGAHIGEQFRHRALACHAVSASGFPAFGGKAVPCVDLLPERRFRGSLGQQEVGQRLPERQIFGVGTRNSTLTCNEQQCIR